MEINETSSTSENKTCNKLEIDLLAKYYLERKNVILQRIKL